MIRRGPDDRQAERDVDRLVEVDQLDRDQALVVVHRDQRVVPALDEVAERRIGHQRAGEPRRWQGGERRCDHVAILGPEQPALAGVRVEPDHADPRLGDREVTGQRARDQLDRRAQAGRGQRPRDLGERDMHGRERDLEPGSDEEHRDVARTEPAGQHLGVTGERKPGAPGPGLRDRRGHDRRELAAQRRRDRRLEIADLRRAGALAGLAEHDPIAEAIAPDHQLARQRHADRARAALERFAIAVHDDPPAPGVRRRGKRRRHDLGPDASGIPECDTQRSDPFHPPNLAPLAPAPRLVQA